MLRDIGGVLVDTAPTHEHDGQLLRVLLLSAPDGGQHRWAQVAARVGEQQVKTRPVRHLAGTILLVHAELGFSYF